jgi:uncharacterized protein YdcH (DUF465 family)
MTAPRTAKRIDPNAYNALADALSVIFWNKRPLERYLRGLLRESPEVLAGLDFNGDTKRETAGKLVEWLMVNEARYQGVTIALMLAVAALEQFPNLVQQDDGQQMVVVAKAAIAELRQWTARHQAIVDEHARLADEIAKTAERASRSRVFSESVASLKTQFLDMHRRDDAQARGKEFEGFINELFGLFDLEPRAAYSLVVEGTDRSRTLGCVQGKD